MKKCGLMRRNLKEKYFEERHLKGYRMKNKYKKKTTLQDNDRKVKV